MAMLTHLDIARNTCASFDVEDGQSDQGKENPVSLCLVLCYLIKQTSFSLYKKHPQTYVNGFIFSYSQVSMLKQEQKAEERPWDVHFLQWNTGRFGPLAQGVIGMCIILGCEGPEERIPRPHNGKVGCYSASDDCLQSQQIQTARVERSCICGGEKIRLGLDCPLGFYFSRFILTFLLQIWLILTSLSINAFANASLRISCLVGAGVGGVGWESCLFLVSS